MCQLELVPFLPEPLGRSKGTEIVKVQVQARYGTCTVKERCGGDCRGRGGVRGRYSVRGRGTITDTGIGKGTGRRYRYRYRTGEGEAQVLAQ